MRHLGYLRNLSLASYSRQIHLSTENGTSGRRGHFVVADAAEVARCDTGAVQKRNAGANVSSRVSATFPTNVPLRRPRCHLTSTLDRCALCFFVVHGPVGKGTIRNIT